MNVSTIQKYKGKSISQLIKIATRYFNAYIRERDKPLGCISCGGRVEHAGHYYSAGHHSSLRFNEKNVNGQCLRCNNFLHGNLIEYTQGIQKKWGIVEVLKLSEQKNISKKWDRFTLIEIIEKYRVQQR